MGHKQEDAAAHGGWWLTLVVWEQSSCWGGWCTGELELVLLTSYQWHDFLHRGAAWRNIAHEFQCSMLCKGKSCSGNLDLSCVTLLGLILHVTQAVLSVQWSLCLMRMHFCPCSVGKLSPFSRSTLLAALLLDEFGSPAPWCWVLRLCWSLAAGGTGKSKFYLLSAEMDGECSWRVGGH